MTARLDAARIASFLCLYSLTLGQGFLNGAFNFATAFQTEHFVHDFTVAADVKRSGKELHTAVGVSHSFLAYQHWIVHAQVFGKFSDIFRAGLVHGDTDYL